MVDYGSKVLLGTISCLAEDTNKLDKRIEMHQKQLDFLEEVTELMSISHGVGPLPYFRIEQGYSTETAHQVITSLPITSIQVPCPIPPGQARNMLLSILYDSNADWLVCMDDDHSLFTHYACYELFWDLAATQMQPCAIKKCLIIPVPAYWEGFKDEVFRWGHAETDWYFKRARIWGYLPIVAIPNLVKYGYESIWFHEGDFNDRVPEDLKFEIDWVAAGGSLVQCYMWAARSCGRLDASSIFIDEQERIDRIRYIHNQWAPSYLKRIYPRNPELWTERGFKVRKNPTVGLSVPRTWKYTMKETDLPMSAEDRVQMHSRRIKRS